MKRNRRTRVDYPSDSSLGQITGERTRRLRIPQRPQNTERRTIETAQSKTYGVETHSDPLAPWYGGSVTAVWRGQRRYHRFVTAVWRGQCRYHRLVTAAGRGQRRYHRFVTAVWRGQRRYHRFVTA